MKFTRYRLVTLLEILEIEAEPFCRLNCVLGQMLVHLEMDRTLDGGQLGGAFGELQRLVESTKWRQSIGRMDNIKEHLFSGEATPKTLRPLVVELYNTLRYELDERFFLLVAPENETFYRQDEPLFGASVDAALGSSAAEDLSEAGKCYALGRYTAAVFHLMRVMEKAVQIAADKLDATVTDKHGEFLSWGVILSNMDDKIKPMRGDDGKAWSEAHTLLFHVNKAWRKETMHPKRTYTPEQAKDVFDACRSFTRHLTKLI